MKLIKDQRTEAECRFRERLRYKSNDMINIKVQTVLEAITNAFEGDTLNTASWIYFYFHNFKIAMEVDEHDHESRDINCEIESQKAIKKNLVVILLELILIKKIIIFLKP